MDFNSVADEWFKLQTTTLCWEYRQSIKSSINHIKNTFSDKDIEQIKPKDIDLMIAKFSKYNPNTKKPMSKKTMAQLIRVANSIFEFALENDIISNNPAKNKKVPKNLEKNQRRALTELEKSMIITTNHKVQLGALIMMFTGLRVGELIPLTWKDIDFDLNAINVNKSVARECNTYKVKRNTKNGKSRIVPFPEVLVDKLTQAKLVSSSKYILPKSDNKMQTPTSWKKLWQSYINELNYINLPSNKNINRYNPNGFDKSIKITPHMLRHTYATMLYTSGVDVKTASKLLGHSSISTTLAIYTHLENEKKILSIQKFDDYINQKYSTVM